ncbi:MAG TPA: 50S ribosomal protein L15 [Polyangiales bacterium]
MAEDKRTPILSRLSPPAGAVRGKHRIGRGIGSGWGKTGGLGQKGQKARGTMKRLGFQGGQMPLQRRLPKIGFNNIFGVEYAPVNVQELSIFDAGTVIDEALLRENRIVRGRWDGIKLLGTGDLDKKLTVKVHAVSASAREKIEKAGGSVELLPRPNKGPRAAE